MDQDPTHEDFILPQHPLIHLDWNSGALTGAPVQVNQKTLEELDGLFRDTIFQPGLNPKSSVYLVRWWPAAEAGEKGGLLWGVTILEPGKVADEFFMTHGHFHEDRSRSEYYATASGSGILLRMARDRTTWGEEMVPGSLHFINGQHAHRVVNTGNEPLIFWGCWGSDAGYDYGTIREKGFGLRVLERDGKLVMVPND